MISKPIENDAKLRLSTRRVAAKHFHRQLVFLFQPGTAVSTRLELLETDVHHAQELQTRKLAFETLECVALIGIVDLQARFTQAGNLQHNLPNDITFHVGKPAHRGVHVHHRIQTHTGG